VIKAALTAAGAPEDLVQIVTGYGEAGNAVVTGGEGGVVVRRGLEICGESGHSDHQRRIRSL